ncbi:LPS translocon maturation chaperone LptM [Wenzhouxiangella marina]|uniref:Uncharacterized protein n=1 Tax=Wenzhouxiangella marina TaxID=1579979 RepID=A0A0K0XX93_9GAMM|nr:lipoprotein [Wenzhouxiangella marina]AKS42300.1 hypothetical protein WM2015_1934 [Wenzhouxiangella marina]MBB6085927.1 putative small lipoprotein YifL [Wenzhouxiangella marina]
MRLILPGLLVLLLAACGLKDDLYLPEPTQVEATQDSQTEDRANPDSEDTDDEADS